MADTSFQEKQALMKKACEEDRKAMEKIASRDIYDDIQINGTYWLQEDRLAEIIYKINSVDDLLKHTLVISRPQITFNRGSLGITGAISKGIGHGPVTGPIGRIVSGSFIGKGSPTTYKERLWLQTYEYTRYEDETYPNLADLLDEYIMKT